MATRTQAVESKYLAIIATIFLPMTSMAVSPMLIRAVLSCGCHVTYHTYLVRQSLLYLSVFKWDNEWVDEKFHPVGGSGNDSGGDSGSPGSPSRMPVFSGYGFIFIAISILTTVITVAMFNNRVQRSRREEAELIRAEEAAMAQTLEMEAMAALVNAATLGVNTQSSGPATNPLNSNIPPIPRACALSDGGSGAGPSAGTNKGSSSASSAGTSNGSSGGSRGGWLSWLRRTAARPFPFNMVRRIRSIRRRPRAPISPV